MFTTRSEILQENDYWPDLNIQIYDNTHLHMEEKQSGRLILQTTSSCF